MAIINGRRIDAERIGKEGVWGKDLLKELKVDPGRRPILERNGRVQQIDPNRRYSPFELIDKNGRGAKVSSMPDRSKGHTFGRPRSALSKRIITEQVIDIAEHLFQQGLEFDEDEAHWLVVPNYRLPRRWHQYARQTPLLIAFPVEYPALPPVGFYMKADIPLSPDGHFFAGVAHNAWAEPLAHGWKWYCVYIHEGAWRPAANWREGDNLYTYFYLINEALGN
ncbi:MAG: hypothetical protein N2557_08075 [Hydrogenophilus sp.]|nr:hypothetical protein [Hydrogenophilus sp.]